MNERIKELAEQAGFDDISEHGIYVVDDFIDTRLEIFAELIRADEREQISHTYLKLTLEAVLREREVCSDLIANMISGIEGVRYAEAIRQRGKRP